MLSCIWCLRLKKCFQLICFNGVFFADTEKAETLSLKVAKALAMTAIDVLITPGLADKIKDEFKVATEAEKACR